MVHAFPADVSFLDDGHLATQLSGPYGRRESPGATPDNNQILTLSHGLYLRRLAPARSRSEDQCRMLEQLHDRLEEGSTRCPVDDAMINGKAEDHP